MTPWGAPNAPKRKESRMFRESPSVAFFAHSHFLIIDKHQSVRSLLSGFLRTAGARHITTAASGTEALLRMNTQRFDVVLCDHDLGTGPNGRDVLEAARHKKRLGPASCWLVISAEKHALAVMGHAESRPDGYLLKPVTETALHKKITAALTQKRLLVEVDEALSHGFYEKALQILTIRVRSHPEHCALFYKEKGALLVRLSRFKEALSVFDAALRDREGYSWAAHGKAVCLWALGQREAAHALLATVIATAPLFVEALDTQAQWHEEEGAFEAALATWQAASAKSPWHATRQARLGQRALTLGQPQVAERAYRKAVQITAHSVLRTPALMQGLACALSAQGQVMEAARVLQSAKMGFSDPKDRLSIAKTECQVFLDNDRPKPALEAALSAVTWAETLGAAVSPEEGVSLAALWLRVGLTEPAMTCLSRIVQNHSDDAAVLAAVRQVLNEQGLSDAEALIEQSQTAAQQAMNEGVLLAKAGQWDAALASLAAAQSAMPHQARVHLNAAHVRLSYIKTFGRDPVQWSLLTQDVARAQALAPNDERLAKIKAEMIKSGVDGGTPRSKQ
jgi:DNA-binding NarL/FixJ family response regulator